MPDAPDSKEFAGLVLYQLASIRSEIALMHLRVRRMQGVIESEHALTQLDTEDLERLIAEDTELVRQKTMEVYGNMCRMMKLDPRVPGEDVPPDFPSRS